MPFLHLLRHSLSGARSRGDITLRSFQFQFLLTHRSRSNTLLLRPKLYATTPVPESGVKPETLLKAPGRTRVKGQGE